MDETRTMTREEAATRLRALADSLAKHNSVEFAQSGKPEEFAARLARVLRDPRG